jgi:hypothetical protein
VTQAETAHAHEACDRPPVRAGADEARFMERVPLTGEDVLALRFTQLRIAAKAYDAHRVLDIAKRAHYDARQLIQIAQTAMRDGDDADATLMLRLTRQHAEISRHGYLI